MPIKVGNIIKSPKPDFSMEFTIIIWEEKGSETAKGKVKSLT
jgi:hypothetical protein